MNYTSTTQTKTNRRSLPKGWQWVRLGDVAEYINGMAFKPTDWKTAGLPIIRIQNLTSSEAHFNYYQGDFDKKYLVENGDLLISWSASLDAFIWDRGKAILNQHIFKAVENSQIITREYLYYAVREAMDEIRSQVHGATLKHITRPEFLAIQISLPPLDEQRRIAGRLNEQLAVVEFARKAAEEQLQAARQLRSAYLREVFENEEAKKWERLQLGAVGEIVGGVQKTPNRAPTKFHKPYLTVRNVKEGYLNLSQVERFEVTSGEFERCRLLMGDILIVEGNGSIDQIGRNALFELEGDDWIHQNHIIRVRLPQDDLSPKFVSLFLNSHLGRLQMVEKAKTTSGLYTLSSGKVASLEIPSPPLHIQQEIVRDLKNRLVDVSDIQLSLESQLAEINRLPTSLLREAFAGTL